MPKPIRLAGTEKCAIVDDRHWGRLVHHRWRVSGSGYVYRLEEGRHVWLHDEVLKVEPGFTVDHINRDPLDNRRRNLRPLTANQQQHNQGPRVTNKSGYKGVSWAATKGKWYAKITAYGKQYSLGLHDTPELAAAAYDRAARKHHGRLAYQNLRKVA